MTMINLSQCLDSVEFQTVRASVTASPLTCLCMSSEFALLSLNYFRIEPVTESRDSLDLKRSANIRVVSPIGLARRPDLFRASAAGIPQIRGVYQRNQLIPCLADFDRWSYP